MLDARPTLMTERGRAREGGTDIVAAGHHTAKVGLSSFLYPAEWACDGILISAAACSKASNMSSTVDNLAFSAVSLIVVLYCSANSLNTGVPSGTGTLSTLNSCSDSSDVTGTVLSVVFF